MGQKYIITVFSKYINTPKMKKRSLVVANVDKA